MAITITVTIDDTNEKILKNDLLDINQWVQDAVSGKQNNCWKRFQQEWTTKLMNDESFTDAIPSNKEDFVNLVLSRPDYKSREQREAELGG
jgi:hypothetical protein